MDEEINEIEVHDCSRKDWNHSTISLFARVLTEFDVHAEDILELR